MATPNNDNLGLILLISWDWRQVWDLVDLTSMPYWPDPADAEKGSGEELKDSNEESAAVAAHLVAVGLHHGAKAG